MAGPTRQKPIGVAVRRRDWSQPSWFGDPNECDTHYLGRDERVIVVNGGFPERYFSIDPCRRFRPNARKIRWSHTLTTSQRRGYNESQELSEYRGQLLGTYNVRKLGKLDPKTHILFEHKGEWLKGEVQPWDDVRTRRKVEARRMAAADSKERKRRNRHLRRPTAWDRLLADDDD